MTLNEYIDLTLQVIRSNRHPASGYVTAARLGLALGKASDSSWSDFGFLKLKNYLENLQRAGHVELVLSDKGALSVIDRLGCLRPTQTELPLSRAFNPLRKPVWGAFTMENTRGLRFFGRVDGSVRFGLLEPPKPADEWVQIVPIAPDEQREWARAFLDEKQITNEEAQSALAQANWYPSFVASLEAINHSVAAAWNRLRSNKVSETVRAWCVKNGISLELVFLSKASRGAALPSDASPKMSLQQQLPCDEKRSIVLAALNKLSTEELLNVAIPARLILEAINDGGSSGLKK